ncbi:MAG: hypothetical protein FWF60_07930 [Oscillospiraceae bacterium]|nr:hypothetical protein [Oscillospiraceae bacterium]MCL1952739.1 hypothetical protein [Oscillospiraceae bacterium]
MNDKNARRIAVPALLFAALTLALLLPLRLWQQLHLVEQRTGFWARTDVTVLLLYIGLGVLAAVPAAMALALRKRAVLDLNRQRRVAEGLAAALAAAALVWDALVALDFARRLFSGAGTGDAFLDGPEMQSSSMYYVRSGALACVLEGLSGLVGALFFGELAALDFLPGKKLYLSRAAALAPFAWAVCRILRRFSRTIAYLRVSDLFLGLAMLVALMLFLLAFAQLVSGVHGANKAAVLFAAGIPAAVLALVCFVPRFVVYKVQGFAAPQDAPVEWCDPALALFVLVFIAGRGYVKGKGAPAEEAEEA